MEDGCIFGRKQRTLQGLAQAGDAGAGGKSKEKAGARNQKRLGASRLRLRPQGGLGWK